MISSIAKMTKKAGLAMAMLSFFSVSVWAQNKDIILWAESGKGGCPQAKIWFELPIPIKADQKVSYKITYKSGSNLSVIDGEGELKQNKNKYTLNPGRRETFNGSVAIELTFADKSTATSNEVLIDQKQGLKDKCDWPMTGNQMAADPDPPPPKPKKPRVLGSLSATYQTAENQKKEPIKSVGNVCPITASLTGSIAMNEDGKETVYYRFVRWNARSLDKLQPHYKVDIERFTTPKGNTLPSARIGSQIQIAQPSAAVVPTTWTTGENNPKFSEGVVQLWRVTPGANNTFSYVGRLASVNLSCGSTRGGSKGGDSGKGDAKTSSKPK